ncbi:MAG: hypothetical protein NTY45_11645 [Elusimicrobia bacterium]|nr:hypothetical protein [Elusimicrobiota bacterium]
MFSKTTLLLVFLPAGMFVLLAYALYYIIGSKAEVEKLRREYAAGVETELEAQRLLRRTRRMFIIWVVSVVLHRLFILYWGGIAGLGELLWCLDPWGFLPSLFIGAAYTKYAGVVWSNGDLEMFYKVASLIIDALIICILWLWTRYAFERPETEPGDRN